VLGTELGLDLSGPASTSRAGAPEPQRHPPSFTLRYQAPNTSGPPGHVRHEAAGRPAATVLSASDGLPHPADLVSTWRHGDPAAPLLGLQLHLAWRKLHWPHSAGPAWGLDHGLVEAIQRLDPQPPGGACGRGLPPKDRARARVARLCINLRAGSAVGRLGWSPLLKRGSRWSTTATPARGEAWAGAAGLRQRAAAHPGTGVGGGHAVRREACHRAMVAPPAETEALIGLDPAGPPCNSGIGAPWSSLAASAARRLQPA